MAHENQYYPHSSYGNGYQVVRDAPTVYPQVVIPRYSPTNTSLRHSWQDDFQHQQTSHGNRDADTIVLRSSPSAAPQALHDAQSVHHSQPDFRQMTPKTSAASPPTLDYQSLMLSLVDEYLAAAYRYGYVVSCSDHHQNVRPYYRLISTALACMESLLKRWRLQPLLEAKVRLKYARVLYEDTENLLEAETALTKGIDLCDRNHFVDLKYAMQALLIRVLARSNHKAAMKAAEGMIDDIHTYHHIAWEYAFRFLCAGLSISAASYQDVISATHNLQKLSALAQHYGDRSIFVMAATMEALVHLQNPGPDSVSHSQRALANAQQLQLDQQVEAVPQLRVLIMLVDLACSLRQMDAEQAFKKMSLLHSAIDSIVARSDWAIDGTVLLPMSPKSLNGVTLHAQDIITSKNGVPYLCVHWLPKDDVYGFSYLLSAMAAAHRNSIDGHKAEHFVLESLKAYKVESDLDLGFSGSVSVMHAALSHRKIIESYCFMQLALLRCSRGLWDGAQQAVNEALKLQKASADGQPPEARNLLLYIEGAIAQGTGRLDEAISIYRRPDFSLSRPFNRTIKDQVLQEISILAGLNFLLIARDVQHPAHSLVEPMLNLLRPLCSDSNSKLITASFSLIEGSLSSDSTLKTKQCFGNALNIAKLICNNQITCITLGLMSDKFFKGVVGEQAEKSARAGQAVARKNGNPLWISVTDGMLAETLEKQGKMAEAGMARQEAVRMLHAVPSDIKKA